jgi:hypothetical protein
MSHAAAAAFGTRAAASYVRAAWPPSSPTEAALTPMIKDLAPSTTISSGAVSWLLVPGPSTMEVSAAPTTAEVAASTHVPAATLAAVDVAASLVAASSKALADSAGAGQAVAQAI